MLSISQEYIPKQSCFRISNGVTNSTPELTRTRNMIIIYWGKVGEVARELV